MTEIIRQLSLQYQSNQPRRALITDIDNTFYRADSTSAIAAAQRLREQYTNNHQPIIAVTGNSYQPAMRQRLDSGELPNFEVIVGSVGTEIWYQNTDGTYVFDTAYDDRLHQTGYESKRVVAEVSSLMDTLNATMPRINMTFQNGNSTYKTSLHFFANDDKGVVAVTDIFARQFPQFKIVTCEEIHYNATLQSDTEPKKYCLDVVPATKSDAVNYLVDTLNLQEGIVAGDSGNDIDMLLDTPDSFTAVVVGGYKKELGDAVAAATSGTDGPFRLRGNKRVFIDDDAQRKAAETLIFVDDYLSQ